MTRPWFDWRLEEAIWRISETEWRAVLGLESVPPFAIWEGRP